MLFAGTPDAAAMLVIPEIDQSATAWCRVQDCLVFLDIAGDRYFRLPDGRNAELIAQMECHDMGTWFQPRILPRPTGWSDAIRTSSAIDRGGFELGEVARAVWAQRRIEARLGSRSLQVVLKDLQGVLAGLSGEAMHMTATGEACVRGFEHARLIRTAADRCLPRAIALAFCLARRGCRPYLIIGIKTSPFGAHSWVQCGADVVSDSVEEVRRYHPILVL